MKYLDIIQKIHTIASILIMLFALMGCSVSMYLPQIGQVLPNKIKEGSFKGYCIISPADMDKIYEIKVDSVEFEVAIDEKSRIKYIQTYNETFITDDGIKVGMTYEQVQKISKDIRTLIGWAYCIPLPSGWNAAFTVGSSMTEHFPDKDAQVKFLFRWE